LLADLALVGFGNVGRRFAGLIEERRGRLAADFDLTLRICGIATRRHGSAWDAGGLDVARAAREVEAGRALTSAAGSADLIAELSRSDAPLRIVVETTTLDIAAGQPAIDHVRAAIDAGCHVVTANKGPVAFAYDELRDRAGAAGVSFLFEGAVMDGIPIFNLVREALPLVDVIGFRGVVNATTNHILSALEDGEAFAPALARMQAAGIAEADASLDLDGWDAAAKTAALANVLMGARMTPHDVDRIGIDEGSGPRAREAVAQGNRLRLVASASRGPDGRVRGLVRPTVLPGGDLLAGLTGQANALVLQTDLLGEIAIGQLGGSLTQTAYALVSDIVTIRTRQPAPAGARARRTL
jgi:homoserine dehydrogenase